MLIATHAGADVHTVEAGCVGVRAPSERHRRPAQRRTRGGRLHRRQAAACILRRVGVGVATQFPSISVCSVRPIARIPPSRQHITCVTHRVRGRRQKPSPQTGRTIARDRERYAWTKKVFS